MPEISSSRYLVQAGWNDVPHLDEKTKKELLDATPPYLREARSLGKPNIGAGAIYPVPEAEIVVDPFDIPAFWPRGYGMDVGWKRTAAIWGAYDRSADTIYLNTEHYRGEAEPSTHAMAIKARGEWIPGFIDPASRARSVIDGRQLIADYGPSGLGLNISPAINAVEAGLLEVWQRLASGRLKVFRTCLNWFAEYRLYRRNDKGVIVKENDHLMDCTRYLVLAKDQMICMPAKLAGFTPQISNGRAGY